MRIRTHAALAALLLVDAAAQISLQGPTGGSGSVGPAVLYGTWGTTEQCAAHRAGIRDDFARFPYVISDQWIQHGLIYCRIFWRAHHNDENVTLARAMVQCGEDGVRDYRVSFRLQQGLLQMRWSEHFTTRPLERCP